MGAAPDLGPYLLIECGGLGVGLCIQLPVQVQPQLPKGLRRCRIVPTLSQHLHQRPLRALPRRIDGRDPPQVALSRCMIPTTQRLRRQCLQRPQIRLLPRLPLLEHPILGTPLQQRSPVEGDRFLQRLRITPGEGGIKGQHVHEGAGQLQREGARRGRAQPAGCGTEGVAEVGEAVAQAVQPLGRGAVGPEQPRQPLPLRLGSLAQREPGEEPLAPAVAEAWERLAAEAHLERSEQPDAE